MSYILASDLKRLIQTDNLSQITGSDDTLLDYAIMAAIIELKTYLVQKYIVDDEIKDFVTYASNATYYYGQRLILTADAYNSAVTYAAGDLAIKPNTTDVYLCLNATSGAFADADWSVIAANGTKYYTILPAGYTPFDYQKYYAKDDNVYYAGRLYTAKQATPILSQQSALQYGNTANLPLRNVFPNAPNASQYWTDNGAYTIPNQAITNTGVFAQGDNRNHQLVNICIDITLYHLHSRIAPRNIPDLRVKRYDDARKWLKRISTGDLTADLPQIQPQSGSRIRWGSAVKQQNNY
jgi:hypothetical protein